MCVQFSKSSTWSRILLSTDTTECHPFIGFTKEAALDQKSINLSLIMQRAHFEIV
jgi:hypothetical protein